MSLDPVTLEIINHKFTAIADEMTLNLKRASRSVYVKEAADFGTGLVDLTGHIFALPSATSVSSLDVDCQATIEAVGALEPGDVILTNDPYRSRGLATHLPDLQIVKPFFHEGKIVAYGWCFVHFMDVGGRVPASISPTNTEIFQEGLIIPPCKIVRAGVMNQDIVNFLMANSRTPDQNIADVKAMIGAMGAGEKRFLDLIERHGVATVIAAESEIQNYAAVKSREVLRQLPDGVYEFWDYMDDDIVSGIPVRYRVKMTVRDGEVELDPAYTDPNLKAAFNFPSANKQNAWHFNRLAQFILSHDSTIPKNFGIYRHLRFVNAPGTVLEAEFPDAVGVRHAAVNRFNDATHGALLKAAPHLMVAPTAGLIVPVVLAVESQTGGASAVTVVEPMVGGRGAYEGGDGVDARDNGAANLSNHPLETVEAEIPIIVRRYDARPDSGGAGRWRGGVGQVLSFEVLVDGCTLFARGMDRSRFMPWGYGGARPSKPMHVVVNEGEPNERVLGKIDAEPLACGDVVTFYMPGGSGYGDPLLRDPAAVAKDVRLGFVGMESARADYGVVLGEDLSVDTAETARLRASLAGKAGNETFAFGPEREAWEAVFDDATMTRINSYLCGLPKSLRTRRRRQIFESVSPVLAKTNTIPLAEALVSTEEARQRLEETMQELGVP